MRLIIKEIILWPRNHAFGPRVINLEPNKINVITGESGTGKSTVSDIIDYVLGSGKCAIPVGLIRQKCEWYGMLIDLEHGEMLVARRDPDEQQSTGDMFIQEGKSLTIPRRIPDKNINVEAFKDKMDQFAGIPKIEANAGASEYAKPIYPAFRDMAAFNFQPQHIIANPYTLFFKTDTTEHREKLRTIFPFVLGSVTPLMLLQQKELKDLENRLRVAKQDLESRSRASERWLQEIESYYIEALRYGLIEDPVEDRGTWTPERYMIELRKAKEMLNTRSLPSLAPGVNEQYVDELQAIIRKEDELSRNVGDLARRLERIKGLNSAYIDYQLISDAQNDRLQSVGWLKKNLKDEFVCPLCAAHKGEANPILMKLFDTADKFAEITSNIRIAPSNLDAEFARLRKELREKEDLLGRVRRERVALQDKTKEQSEHRQHIKQIYWFAGKLDQALQSFSPSGRVAELRNECAELEEKIRTLRALVNPNVIKERLDAALISVSRRIEIVARDLTLEHSSENVMLDHKELTVKFKGSSGRTDYLWEVGSGQNWVGYHLATLLAIHRHFLTLPDNPVPSFLIFDQPSQVYFPESSWTTLEAAPAEVAGHNLSEDIKGVRRIFKELATFLTENIGKFQIIVTEHAGAVTWEEVQESINVVGNWRGRSEDYLIPQDWLR